MNDTEQITGTKAWKHKLLLTSWRGKTRGTCHCGWQHTFVPSDESVTIVDAYKQHAGLIEHKPKTHI